MHISTLRAYTSKDLPALPPLTGSHRLTGVTVPQPQFDGAGLAPQKEMQILRRLTIDTDTDTKGFSLRSIEPVLRQFDMVAVIPRNETVLSQIALKSRHCSIVQMDLKERVRMGHKVIKECLTSGLVFECCYSPALFSVSDRRRFIEIGRKIYAAGRGKGLSIASGATMPGAMLAPLDACALAAIVSASPRMCLSAVPETAFQRAVQSVATQSVISLGGQTVAEGETGESADPHSWSVTKTGGERETDATVVGSPLSPPPKREAAVLELEDVMMFD
ncbi:RNase P subunit p30 [Kipferlia bialata]|uniref:RNase P subunit p30 n=1 Tax=Kipferlia bialata TaxID=797122 RepID=A0A9K3GJH1_9EUKA|nr:RNase P subunit p30 [Kipferlia bialata]|eukprot:g7939.t1